ncbi:MAG: helix-turn-helix domain-containing protein [bacterium]
MLNSLLQSLNFSEKETFVYMALLELGSAKAIEISKKTNLNRTTVYDLMESLMQKGLISKYKKGSNTFFNALEPERLITYLDREKEEKMKIIERQKKKVKELLPQLMSLENIASTKPRVQFFEGEKGMREAYEDTLTSKEIILAFANLETMYEGLPNFFPEYFKRRSAKKIFIRAIIPRNKLSVERVKVNQEEMRDTRFLPEEKMSFSPEVNIYNNKMLIASWKEKMAIIIESKELADLQKLAFNILWETLPRN